MTSNPLHPRLAGMAVAVLALAALGVTSCAPTEAPSAPINRPTVPIIMVDPGLRPRLSAEHVAADVLDRIHQMEAAVGKVLKPARVIRVAATNAAGVTRLEPASGLAQPAPPGIFWVVRAEGTFTSTRGGRAGIPVPIVESGFYVISDADGAVVGYGFP